MENLGGRWIKTSFNTNKGVHDLSGTPLRKNFAFPGYYYDEVKDAFIPPQNYPSWTLNDETCVWEAPTPMPDDDELYIWVEDDLNWQLVEGV